MRKLQKISILINAYPFWSNLHYDLIRRRFGIGEFQPQGKRVPKGRPPQMDNPSDLMLVNMGHSIAHGRSSLHTSGFAGVEACGGVPL
jgi:hypothetical protein